MKLNDAPLNLPEFVCHKRVRAAKITAIEIFEYGNEIRLSIVLPNGNRDFIEVPNDWGKRHKPEVGGYIVQYGDGYASYSPAKAFEEGYTQVLSEGAPA